MSILRLKNMTQKYKIITLCGSIKFKEDFLREQTRLTMEGNIVLCPNFFNDLNQTKLTAETIQMLGEMHKQKIDMSHEIFVINKNGYVGDNTESEIKYATNVGKKVVYMENIN